MCVGTDIIKLLTDIKQCRYCYLFRLLIFEREEKKGVRLIIDVIKGKDRVNYMEHILSYVMTEIYFFSLIDSFCFNHKSTILDLTIFLPFFVKLISFKFLPYDSRIFLYVILYLFSINVIGELNKKRELMMYSSNVYNL